MNLTKEQKLFILRLLSKDRSSSGIRGDTLYLDLYRGVRFTSLTQRDLNQFLEQALKASLVNKGKDNRWMAGSMLANALNGVQPYAGMLNNL